MKRKEKEGNIVNIMVKPYLFDPPRKDVFEGSGVPSFLSTPKRWTKMIMSVIHIDDYVMTDNIMSDSHPGDIYKLNTRLTV